MAERFLVLGTTGVEKRNALSNVKYFAKSQGLPADFHVIDFEKDYVLTKNPRLKMHRYLDAAHDRQRQYWNAAWEHFHADYKELGDKAVALLLHGVLTRPVSGTQCPANLISLILKYLPTRIVALLDDVYAKWHRTETRARDGGYKGKPTLEQLVDARRAECFFGELVASNVSPPASYHVLAVRHPARTLYRLLFVPQEDLLSIYLSFPISEPRRMRSENDDDSGIEEVNAFLKKARDFESSNGTVACFCPLAIDEFPLLSAEERREGEETFKVFKKNSRWNVRDFCDNDILLCEGVGLPESIEIPSQQVNDAEGFISRDVALRDYRLVTQSQCLAVFNPWFNGRQTGGGYGTRSMLLYTTKFLATFIRIRNTIQTAMLKNC